MRSATARWTCKTCSSARLPSPSRSRFQHLCRDPSAVRLRRLPRRHSRLTRRIPHPDLRERLSTATFTILADSRHHDAPVLKPHTRQTGPENDRVDADFGLLAAALLVPETECVGDLVTSGYCVGCEARLLARSALEISGADVCRLTQSACMRGVWASARPAASDASSVRWMRAASCSEGRQCFGADTLAPPGKADPRSAPVRTIAFRPERASRTPPRRRPDPRERGGVGSKLRARCAVASGRRARHRGVPRVLLGVSPGWAVGATASLRRTRGELVARADVELGEHLVEVVLDGAWTDE
jgi:hypothetical protein